MSDSPALSDYPRYAQLAYARGGAPSVLADLKTEPEDFVVEEDLGFDLSGNGEHLWLFIESRDMNTDFVVKQLASAFELERRAISYSGKKDRRAVTRQWFSLHVPGRFLPGKPIGLPDTIHPDCRVLRAECHQRKLRRGTHQANQFTIRLRRLQGDVDQLEHALQQVLARGFPNYFGLQRFGHDERNVDEAVSVMQQARRMKREQRDRVFSTLRSWDFNHLLSLRVAENSWQRYLTGDIVQLRGSHSVFQPEAWDSTLQERLEQGDIEIAGVMPGKGAAHTPLSQGNYDSNTDLQQYLTQQRVEQGYRALGVRPDDLTWQRQGDELLLSFSLPKGAYATALLREVVCLRASIESDAR